MVLSKYQAKLTTFHLMKTLISIQVLLYSLLYVNFGLRLSNCMKQHTEAK